MRLKFRGVALALLLVTTPAHAQSLAVLKVVSDTQVGDFVTLRLVSGTTITVPASDIDPELTQVLLGGLKLVEAETQAVTAPVDPGSAETTIRVKCEREWPTDFSVRAYCEKTQREAITKLAARQMTAGDRLIIRRKCAEEWPDDFSVRNFCEEQQLNALGQLGR